MSAHSLNSLMPCTWENTQTEIKSQDSILLAILLFQISQDTACYCVVQSER